MKMKPKLLVLATAICLSQSGTSLGQFNVKSISKNLDAQIKSLSAAKEVARKAGEAEKQREAAAAAERERQRRIREEAARRDLAARTLQIAQSKELAALRELAERQAKEIEALKNANAEEKQSLEAAREELAARERTFELERKVFTQERAVLESKEELARAEKRQEVQRWYMSFMVTLMTACIGGISGVFGIIKAKHEINRLKREGETPAKPNPDNA
jgi:chromosome segregation ATPase